MFRQVVPWERQPPIRSAVNSNHPLAKALQLAWVGGDLSGVDIFQGYRVPLLSGTTISARAQGRAFAHTGTSGSLQAFPSEATLPYVQIGYGYFNTAGGGWLLSSLNTAAGGYLSRLALASSTTVAADVRWNFGTSRTLTITLPTTLDTPICVALVAYSSTDYRFFCNGQQQNGTLSPGTFGSLDRMFAPGDTINGGVWFTGFGSGVALDDGYLIKLTANPGLYLWSLFQKSRILPFNSVGGGSDVTLPLTGQAVSIFTGSFSLAQTVPLAGQAVTASSGAVAPSFSKALTGTAVTSSAGTLGPNISLSLLGQAVSALAGTLTASSGGNITLALTGQAVSALAGTLSVGVSKPLVGTSLTTFAGTLTPSSGTALITLKAGSWLRYRKLQ